MIVRVPASSANLGPGFDALGMALSLHAELGVIGDDAPPDGAREIDEHHPASIAFRACGGAGVLWVRCPIPAGRGLGFSGAVRVGGAVLAVARRETSGHEPSGVAAWRDGADEILRVVTELEGHADNVAASLFGGVVATAAGHVVQVPLALDPAVVVWVPSFATATSESRRSLGGDVRFDDGVFNVARAALLVAALAAGDIEALRTACEDRLHQDARLARAAPSRAALDAALGAGAWAAWLSGSGPTVAAMCAPDDADRLAAAMPGDGHSKVLRIDRRGAVVEAT
jgi:homoserine kinase